MQEESSSGNVRLSDRLGGDETLRRETWQYMNSGI